MGIGAFAAAGLVPVAYAQVESNGTSTTSNSGVTVTRLQAGAYSLVLPEDISPPDEEAYPVVTIWGSPGVTVSLTPTGPSGQRIWIANFVAVSSGLLVDTKFAFAMFRTVAPLGNGVPA